MNAQRLASLALAAVTLLANSPARAQAPVGPEPSVRAPAPDARAMIDRALAWLRTQQDPATGGWSATGPGPKHPAISALVLAALLDQPDAYARDAAVAPGIKFLLNYQQEDGGIYDQILPSYNTSISIVPLAKVRGEPRVDDARRRAVEYLKRLQYSETSADAPDHAEAPGAVDRSHAFYGGWGYGNRGRPDLSNTAFALDALAAAGVEPTDPAFARAVTFLERCQMLERTPSGTPVNDLGFARGSTQGGFVYATSVNKDAVGQGQSFAGETVESLSEGPGTLATVRLGTDADSKPLAMTKEQAAGLIVQAALDAGEPEVAPLARSEFLVLLGPTGDGRSSSTLLVRSPVTDADATRGVLARAFKGVLAPRDALTVEPVNPWKGASRLRAYGTMSYSGFKSYLHANLARDDERVLAALGWICRNYTLAENPGVGTDGLYYYYLVFARALRAWGEPTIPVVGADGVASPRDWGADLARQLATLQDPDGSYRPVDDRWLEDNRVLITAYATLALEAAFPRP